MSIREKKENLKAIYDRYDSESAEFREKAICKAGCAFCCTDVGNVDVTTLEGLVIRDHLAALPKAQRKQLRKNIEKNMARKEKEKISRCPFLRKNDTCAIYDIRPFSCRQLYSLKECRGSGPTVHREAAARAGETVKALQRLDETGYSGHISFILHLLEQETFRKLYLAGGFDPSRIMEFGKSHGIVINKFVSGS